MRQALERHSGGLGPGAPPVEYGIGVHSGLAVVGNIGARDRLQNYTAIGDAVNTAQRLQAGASANQILLSAATYFEVMPIADAHELEPMSLKGKTRPLSVYQLDGLR
jgi:adenylate cyclase